MARPSSSLLALLVAIACATSEKASQSCRESADCPDGVCQSGRCVPSADGGDDASDGAGGGAGKGGASGSSGDAGTGGSGGVDAGTPDGDADVPDAAEPADAPPEAPTSAWPANGWASGSALAPTASLTAAPRRPRLAWSASTGATRYEVELDATCDPAAFASCPFASAVSETAVGTWLQPAELAVESASAPVGRRWFWRVRACNDAGCSPFGNTRYVNVGRMPSDFDGDGYADAAVAAHLNDAPEPDEGEVYVYRGSPTGLAVTPSVVLASVRNEADGQVGVGLAALGDVNGDGFADLAVGAPTEDGLDLDVGRVYVYLGSGSGLPASPSQILEAPSPQASAYFGWAVAAAGDVNADGFDDLLVAAPLEDGAGGADEGRLYVYAGSSGGLPATPTQAITLATAQPGAQLGTALTACDLDGDGFGDVVAAAELHDAGTADQGAVFVHHGSPAGLEASPRRRLDNPENEPGARFGADVACQGDLDGDGFADLVVGARAQDAGGIDGGKLWVYRGSPAGVSATWSWSASGGVGQASFGTSLSTAADLDADGFSDVVVGAASDASSGGQGRVHVLLGGPTGIPTIPDLTLLNPNPVDGVAAFGVDVATVDARGDGLEDLLVGAHRATALLGEEGRVHVFDGTATGISTGPVITLENPLVQVGRFGRRVAGR